MNRVSALILLAALAMASGCGTTGTLKKAASAAADLASLAKPEAAGTIEKAKKTLLVEEKEASAYTEAELIAILAARYGYSPSVVYRHKGAVVESSDLSKSVTLEKVRTADDSSFVLDSTPEFSSIGSAAAAEPSAAEKAKATMNKIADAAGAGK